MSGQGFGFTPGDDDDRDDRDDGRGDQGQNPFGGFGFFGFPMGGAGQGGPGGPGGQGGPGGPGGLGDFLNQLGQMMSGMGQQMNAQDGAPVDHSVTERIARQRIGQVAPVRDSEREALTDALRLAELWLDDATTLPAGANRAEGWNSLQWLEHTLPTWKRIVDPVAEQMAEASVAAMPEEAREMMGPLLGMMSHMNSMNFGVQLGGALADLAKDALTGSDLVGDGLIFLILVAASFYMWWRAQQQKVDHSNVNADWDASTNSVVPAELRETTSDSKPAASV